MGFSVSYINNKNNNNNNKLNTNIAEMKNQKQRTYKIKLYNYFLLLGAVAVVPIISSSSLSVTKNASELAFSVSNGCHCFFELVSVSAEVEFLVWMARMEFVHCHYLAI